MIGFLFIIAVIGTFYVYLYRNWDYKKKFTFKTVMIYITSAMLLLTIWIVIVSVRDAAEEEQYNMLETRLENVRRDESSADYRRMQDTLLLYEDFEPEFEYAWERAEMYANYTRYLIFAGAVEAGMGEEYERMADKYKEALLELCESPDYPENIPYAEDFLKRASLAE